MSLPSTIPKTLAIHGGTPVRPRKKAANPVISDAAREEIEGVLREGTLAQFYGGSRVGKFEAEYARWFGRSEAVAVNSGTAALHVAYLATRIPERSEVLLPANAYVSALSALIQANLIPIIVDIDPVSWCMDPNDCAHKVTDRTSSMVPVHMYGQPCPMGALRAIADRYRLILIEDCGQAHGARWDGVKTGTFGAAAAFSLCCRKHITVGEGGIIVTNDPQIARTARALAHKGKGRGWFDYWEMGFSYNMTEIQAVLGLHQLARLDDELDTRVRLAAQLREGISDMDLAFPVVPSGSAHAYFKQNVLLPPQLAAVRNDFVAAVRAENVGCDPSHPHLLDIGWVQQQRPYFYRTLSSTERPDYGPDIAPVARDVLARQICIEVGPGLDSDDMDFTIEAIRKVFFYFAARAVAGRGETGGCLSSNSP